MYVVYFKMDNPATSASAFSMGPVLPDLTNILVRVGRQSGKTCGFSIEFRFFVRDHRAIMARNNPANGNGGRGLPPGETTVFAQIQTERHQGHPTRRELFERLSRRLGRSVITFFTSFRYPVQIGDEDADVLEGILRKTDLSNGLPLMISSPGGDGLAAERIVNICRSYSGTGEFWAIVPGKAKSAATMICFGASRIIMGPSSELGPVDPQLIYTAEDGTRTAFSAHHLVNSYDKLFAKAIDAKGRLEPFLQQLANYDEREIEEFRAIIELADDIAVRTLKSGMMSKLGGDTIKKKIERFLSPKQTKSHGRPIFRNEATECGLRIRAADVRSKMWGEVYELYVRSNELVSARNMKCIESIEDSFAVHAPAH